MANMNTHTITLAACLGFFPLTGCAATHPAGIQHVVLIKLNDPSLTPQLIDDCDRLLPAIDGVVGAVFSWSERGVPMPPNRTPFLGACAMREGARAANLRHHPLTTAGATPRRQPWRLGRKKHQPFGIPFRESLWG